MTDLPKQATGTKLGLVIDLDICVGCHACAVNCKEWNTGGHSAPLTDRDPYGSDPSGVWFNRVHTFEAGDGADSRTVHFPRSCLHCEEPACVTVCPTGASYKREEDGIVLVNADTCIGCKLCSWACPYGAREYDVDDGVMKKCTLCIDRIYNENLDEVDRVPACVSTCPAGARHFGDLGDPTVAGLPARRGARRHRPDAGARLQARQQVPAAAAAQIGRRRHPGARARTGARAVGGGHGRRWPGRRVPRLGRPNAVAMTHPAGSPKGGEAPTHPPIACAMGPSRSRKGRGQESGPQSPSPLAGEGFGVRGKPLGQRSA